MRMLKCGFLISDGYIFPSFVNHKYPNRRKMTIEKIKSLECAHCFKTNIDRACRACTGCMKAVYCSKKCQKIDWKMKHRKECNRIWNARDFPIYHLLKSLIF